MPVNKSEKEKQERRGVKSVDMSGVLLEFLCDTNSPASLKSIAEHGDVAPAKAHRYLASLIRTGLVSQDARTSLYDLGPLAKRLGTAAISRDKIIKRGLRCLEDVAIESRTTGHFSVWGQHGPVIIAVEHGGPPVLSSLGIGMSPPLSRSATGRIFLAFMNRRSTQEILDIETKQFNVATDDVLDEASTVKERGYATVDGALIPGLSAISGPVFDHRKALVAAITLIYPDEISGEEKKKIQMIFERHLGFINK